MKSAALLCAVLLAACSSGNPTTAAHTSTAAPSPTATSGVPTTKVVTIVLENHGDSEALQGMPYLSSLAQTYGHSSNYANLAHPSLPNYLAMAAGSTFEISDDLDADSHPLDGTTVFDSANAAVYAEGMTSPCQADNKDKYAGRHNAWTYFAQGHDACVQRDLPLTDLNVQQLPTVGLIVPDLCHDAHDCELDEADGFLKEWVPKLIASPDYTSGKLALVVIFDEVENGGQGKLLTTVIAPRLKGVIVDAPLNHLAWCRWMTDLEGAAPLRDAAGAPSLGAAFGLT